MSPTCPTCWPVRPDWPREARLLVAAASLLTRIPLPAVRHDPDWLPRSVKYLPLVGAAVGLAGAAVLLVAAYVWPRPIPEILALASGLALTGALHEDGLADTCDGLGGATPEARLAIMKDSRLGTFGALALGVALAIQLGSLTALPPAEGMAAWVAAQAGARLPPALLLATQPYAGTPATAKLAAAPDRPCRWEVAVAAAFAAGAMLPLLALAPGRALAAAIVGAAAAAWFARRTCRALGGQTGDVLGAAAVVFTSGFLLGAAVTIGASG